MHFTGRIRTNLDKEPFNQTRKIHPVAGICSLLYSGVFEKCALVAFSMALCYNNTENI